MTLALYALTVLIWGTTWHAIVYQLAQGTPAFGVTVRFALASAVLTSIGVSARDLFIGHDLRLDVQELSTMLGLVLVISSRAFSPDANVVLLRAVISLNPGS